MHLNTLDVELTPRTDVSPYNVQTNQTTLDILSLIFDFKIATAWQISRFLSQRDQSKYLYLKLNRMWQAKLLESFKVYTGTRSGMPVYYMLSKDGLKILAEKGIYNLSRLKNYPQAKTLLSWSLFKHEAEVVELASMEIKNRSKNFSITFKGESSSVAHDYMSDKNIEVLTPDYTVFYLVGGLQKRIYSEFERTQKSKPAMLRKIERYIRYLDPEQLEHTTLRFIFQTPSMEESFWLNILSNKANFLQRLRILSTNLLFLNDYKQFLEPIYAAANTVKFFKAGHLAADMSQRIKLFSFL
jgi:hypothetical protein